MLLAAEIDRLPRAEGGTLPDWEVLAMMIAATLRSGDNPVAENSLPGSPDSAA